MAKPTTLPRWATDGAAPVTEPLEGRKDIGWAPSDRPAAQHINWLFKILYTWIAWLKDQFADDGVKRIQTADTLANLRAITTHSLGDVVLLWDRGLFEYQPLMTGSDDGITLVKPDDVSTGRWVRSDKDLFGQANGYATLNGSSKVVQDPANGKIVKVWGTVQLGASAPSITFGSGNFAVSYVTSGGVKRLRITPTSAFGTSQYVPVVAFPDKTAAAVGIDTFTIRDSAYFELGLYNLATLADIDAGAVPTNDHEVEFSVIGP